jgi:PAS domain S-box-containing protein
MQGMPDIANAPDPRDWLAAIIDGSEDAIVSKNLNGIIQSWNPGATRLFGYAAEEVIGKSITILIPQDRLDEEPLILAQIQSGKRVEHFETKRRRKDGSLVDISLTISPIRNENGVIVGASKIARDITEKRAAQEQQQLLMGEMRHRVKNLFALAKAIVAISAKTSANQGDIIADVQARLSSLARAHDLIMSDRLLGPENEQHVGLLTLVRTILEPYATDDRISVRGNDCDVDGKSVTNLALLLHELATNAAKHGSLSTETGRLEVEVSADDDRTRILWREAGGPPPAPGRAGFGSRLEGGLASALNATVERDWQPTGLVVSIAISRAAMSA